MKIAYLLRTIVEIICQIWKIFPIAFVSVRRRYFYVHLCNLYKTRTNSLIIEMILKLSRFIRHAYFMTAK